ncbi:MAG TPA: MFS transporter [Candidatus Binataceae bacterium]|nr:MFS transporter [Candidatus Binataceae bacterium]
MHAEISQPHSRTIREIIRRYYTVWAVYSLAGGFLFGVYPIFLQSRGLNQAQINSVLAAYLIVLFLTDVPTGAFADLLGRRRSFVLGAALRVAAFVLYFFAHRYVEFLVAECIDGIGTTFGNGAIDAWGVDALDDAGYDGLKDRLFSRIAQLTTAGFMVSALIGARVADIDIAYPWLLGAAGYLISMVVGWAVMRDSRRHSAKPRLGEIANQMRERVADGFRAGFGERTILMLSAAGAITIAAWAPYWLEWPILFNGTFNIGVWIIGVLYCVLAIARMIGAEWSARIVANEWRRASMLAMLTAGASAGLFAAGLLASRPVASLTALFAMNFCTGAMQPLVQSWFNERIDSSQRATLLSFSSTFQTLGGAIGLMFAGQIADSAGIPFEWLVAGMISLCAAPVYIAARTRAVAGAPAAAVNPAE